MRSFGGVIWTRKKVSELLSNPELVERLKACTNPEEIQDLAREKGLTLTRDEATRAFEIFGKSPLQDDELDSVAGGYNGTPDEDLSDCG